MRKPAAVLLVLSLAVLALALVPAAGLAAKGGAAGKPGGGGGGKPGGGGSTGGSSSITLATPLAYDANGNGVANFGDAVKFNVTSTATTEPFVNLQCFQNGVLVANGWKGYFEGSLDRDWSFGLGSGAWQGGAADCTASVNMYTSRGWQRLAATTFHVDA